MKKIYILTLSLFMALTSNAQLTFLKRFHHNVVGTDYNAQASTLWNNQYLVLGTITNEIFVAQHDLNGILLSEHTLGTNGNTYPNNILPFDTASFLVLGLNRIVNHDQAFIYKIDSNGKIAWANHYGETGVGQNEELHSAIYINNKIYACGNKNGILFMRTDNNGNLEKFIEYGGGTATNIMIKDTTLYITGYTSSFGSGGSDLLLLKTTLNGNVISMQTYGGPGNELTYSSIMTSDSNIVIVGSTTSSGAGNTDILITKIDLTGNVVWSKTYGTAQSETGNKVVEDNANNIVVAGSYSGLGLNDFVVLKCLQNGNLITNKIYDYSSHTLGGQALIATNNGYCIVATHYTGTETDYLLAKTNLTCDAGCNNIGQTINVANTFFSTSNVTGLSETPYANTFQFSQTLIVSADVIIEDITCFSSTIGILETARNNSFSVYPNPTSGEFTILLSTDNAVITVTDALGLQIIRKQTAQKTMNLHLDNNGVYIVYAKTKQGTTKQKLIVNH